jgi:hypothetical protein
MMSSPPSRSPIDNIADARRAIWSSAIRPGYLTHEHRPDGTTAMYRDGELCALMATSVWDAIVAKGVGT